MTMLAILALTGAGWGIINPNFTPKHLVEQSGLVVAGPLRPAAGADEWTLKAGQAIKGAAGAQVLSLSGCDKDHVAAIRKTLVGNGAAAAVLFAGTFDEQTRAYLHVAGAWLGVKAAGKGRWNVLGYAPRMTATYAGGTDKLILMSRYVATDPDADVPVTAGVRWMENIKVARIAGEIGSMAAVEFGRSRKSGRRPMCVFVASTAGDRLFRGKVDDEAFEDITAAAKLDTKSRRFCWLDVNADGQADLISWDGSALSVRVADGEGGLVAASRLAFKGVDDCLGLSACSTDGSPGVLVSAQSGPYRLALGAGAGWKKVPLPAGGGNLGEVSPCIVADLDGDGFADVLQPGETAGRLWKGKAGGFAGPVKSPVCTGEGAARPVVADFDQNGSLDVLLLGPKCKRLWESGGAGGFTEVFRYSGSMSYKCPADPSGVLACDLNHDGRADVCVIYPAGELMYHWNRGFRTFGQEGEVNLPGTEAATGQPAVGQRAAAVGDFNNDGSLDLAVVLTDGQLHCFYNERMDMPVLRLRLPKGVTGPVTVSCWLGGKRPVCTGVATVSAHAPAALVTARYRGKVTIKYRPFGTGEVLQKVLVDEGARDVVLRVPAGR